MPLMINPLELTDETRPVLLALLLAWMPRREIHCEQELNYPHPTLPEETCRLTYSLLIRERNASKEGVCIEIYNANTVPQRGSFGVVYFTLGMLKLADNRELVLHRSKSGQKKERILKFFKPGCSPEHEVEMTRHFSELHVKPLVRGTCSDSVPIAVLVARKIPGHSLHHWIQQERKGRVLTWVERVTLSLSLLKALEDQVMARSLVHRDIKPANIMVTPQLEVFIIDCGLAHSLIAPSRPPLKRVPSVSSSPKEQVEEALTEEGGAALFSFFESRIEPQSELRMTPGTLGFIPLEGYAEGPITEKYDLFAMARVLGCLWHIQVPCYSSITDYTLAQEEASKCTYKKGLSPLLLPDEGIRQLIEDTLTAMARSDAKDRASIQDVRVIFEGLLEVTPFNPALFFSAHSVERGPVEHERPPSWSLKSIPGSPLLPTELTP